MSLLPGQQLSILAEALLFDLDGTLVDSGQVAERAWLRWARAHGIDEQLTLRTIHGRRSTESVTILAPQLDPSAEADLVTDMEMEDSGEVRPLPGAQEILEQLRPEEWALVTSCPDRLARSRLSAAGLPEPREVISAERVVKGKPDPEPYLLGATVLGRAPEYCVAFEDAPIGILSARAAGMRVIALRTTYGDRELMVADFVVDTFANVVLGRYDGRIQLHLR